MSYVELTNRLRSDNHLFTVLVELTYRCNLDCYFCYNDLSLKGRSLSKQQYFDFFDDLAEMGVLNLVLSGGEPLSHPDFFELGGYAKSRGFLVRVKSNGHALRGATAKRLLEEVDPFVIDTSLHGGTAETHDRQTRVPGSFDRLLANIAECRALGMKVKINSTLTRWNESELELVFAIADELGCQLQVDPEVTPRDDGDVEPLAIAPTADGIRRLFSLQAKRYRALQEASAEGTDASSRQETAPIIGRQDSELMKAAPVEDAERKHCGAGSVGVAVNPFGDVFPCVQWRKSIGNLHEENIAKIWADRSRLADVRQATIDAASVVASEGEHGSLMSFCPGLAHTKSGDPLKIYDSARSRGKVVLQARRDFFEDGPLEARAAETSTAEVGASEASKRLPVVG